LKVLIYTFFIVLFDQITKLYVKGIKIPFLGIDVPGMPYQSSIDVFGNFFKFTFIENPGMAFGLQIGGKLFLSLFTIFATLLLVVFLYKNRKEGLLLRLSLAFILGGAIGNLIDRVFYGKIYEYAPIFYGRVVDFLHFDFPNFNFFGKTIYSWPIFNIADMFITIGFLMILIGYKKIFTIDESPSVEIPSEDMLLQTDAINNKNEQIKFDTDEKIFESEPKQISNNKYSDHILETDNNKINDSKNSNDPEPSQNPFIVKKDEKINPE